jgi:hypothetical protein
MKTWIISSMPRRCWRVLPLAVLLLLGACDRTEPTAPAAVEPPTPAEQALVPVTGTHVARAAFQAALTATCTTTPSLWASTRGASTSTAPASAAQASS